MMSMGEIKMMRMGSTCHHANLIQLSNDANHIRPHN